jgi:hypothetical protein
MRKLQEVILTYRHFDLAAGFDAAVACRQLLF